MGKVDFGLIISFLKQFSNRELATAIWILVFISVVYLTQHEVRESFYSLVKSFCQMKIPFFVMLSYIGIMLIVLNTVGIWRVSNVAITILWVVCVPFFMLLDYSKVKDESYFINTIKDNVKILVVIEFLINLHVFNLCVELLLFPVFILLGGVNVIARFKKGFEGIKKSINYIMSMFGTFLIGYALYMTVSDFNNFFTLNNFENFILPILLTIMFLPFIYFWALYINYDTLFSRLQFFVIDRALLPYVKKKTILAFGLNLWALNNWSRHINSLEFTNENNVVKSIREFKNLKPATNEKV